MSTTSDRYRRRREAGEASRAETRRRLLAAADESFRADGYVSTTVSAIARSAGVSLQTLYLAWGSKRAMLLAAADAAASDAALPMSTPQWRKAIESQLQSRDDSLSSQIVAMCEVFTGVARRSAPYWRVFRQAAAVDPEIEADWATLTARRRETLAVAARALSKQERRPGLSDQALRDTLFAILSPDVFDLLTSAGGQTPSHYQRWATSTLIATICRE